jgi:uncharacterized protein YggE
MKRIRIKVRPALVAVVAMGVLLALPGFASAQESGIDYTNTVTVAAGATVEIEADIATVTFGIRAGNVDASTATRTVAERTESVVDALTATGVTEEELTVGGLSLGRKTDRRGNFIRYVASTLVKVKTERLDRLAEFIDVAVAAGASSVRGLSYNVKDRSAAVDQALREAMAFARAKATALAESENRQVGPAIVIFEYDSRSPRSVSFDTSGGGDETAASAGTLGRSLVPLAPPTIEAHARITVTFELV